MIKTAMVEAMVSLRDGHVTFLASAFTSRKYCSGPDLDILKTFVCCRFSPEVRKAFGAF